MTPFKRVACGAAFLVTLLVLAGCGDRTMSQVSGEVTIDGKPVEEGAISFYPVDRKSPTTGGDIKGGSYSVAVPVGLMDVKISMPKTIRMKKLYNTPDSPEYPLKEEALPKKYNDETELKLDVIRGRVQKDWELKSK